jgi:hypothetical protein
MRMADLKVSLAQAVIRNARSSLDRRDRGAAIEHDRHELDAGRPWIGLHSQEGCAGAIIRGSLLGRRHTNISDL